MSKPTMYICPSCQLKKKNRSSIAQHIQKCSARLRQLKVARSSSIPDEIQLVSKRGLEQILINHDDEQNDFPSADSGFDAVDDAVVGHGVRQHLKRTTRAFHPGVSGGTSSDDEHSPSANLPLYASEVEDHDEMDPSFQYIPPGIPSNHTKAPPPGATLVGALPPNHRHSINYSVRARWTKELVSYNTNPSISILPRLKDVEGSFGGMALVAWH